MSEDRLASLENTQREHGNQISRSNAVLDQLADKISAIAGQLQDLAKNVQPQWATIFGSMGIVLVLVGFIGAAYVRDIDRLEEELNEQEKSFKAEIKELRVLIHNAEDKHNAHVESVGHVGLDERVTAHNKRIETLESITLHSATFSNAEMREQRIRVLEDRTVELLKKQ